MEPWTSKHTKWLVNTGKNLKTIDGKDVEVWEFKHLKDEKVLSAWAKHFRNHYCLDTDIDFLRGKQTRQDYLKNIKFPCNTSKLGPGIRAGDFGEIIPLSPWDARTETFVLVLILRVVSSRTNMLVSVGLPFKMKVPFNIS